ncbi:MAG: RuBisCO large subunit C-terminal-like domain-containing protein [Rhodothermales bacterium]
MRVTLNLALPLAEAASLASSILIEQTVETPPDVAHAYPFVRERFAGEILSLVPADPGCHLTLQLPDTGCTDAAQCLNVLFGNVSLHEKVSLLDFEPTAAWTSLLPGPRHGIAGLRAAVGIQDRPLLCAAIKPVGMNVDEIASVCARIADGGIDFIKDDHYFSDAPFAPFEARVRACQRAVDDAGQRLGRRIVYVPNLTGAPAQLERQADLAQQLGVGAVMAAPMLVGLPAYRALADRLDIPLFAHPSFAGATRIAPEALFGKLFRLFGADAVIFANYGGRFSYDRDTCIAMARTMRAPLAGVRPALPVPAGGMTVERAGELVDAFGLDAMLLIGGSLLQAADLTARAGTLRESVETAARSLLS